MPLMDNPCNLYTINNGVISEDGMLRKFEYYKVRVA